MMPTSARPRRLLRTALLAPLLALAGASAAADAPPSLPILVYHQIRVAPGGPPDGMTVVSVKRFSDEMRWLHQAGYRTLSMDEVARFLKGEKFPQPAVAIQFDDGWSSALAAEPVLDHYGFQATFWIIVGSVGTGALFLDWAQVRRLDRSSRFKVYSHTMTHPYEAGKTLVDWVDGKTAGKTAADARLELTESKRVLEEKLGRPVQYLDWPAGVFDDALVAMAKEAGYTALVTTVDGMNFPGGDSLRIHRTVIDGACGEKDFRAILKDGRYRACAAPAN